MINYLALEDVALDDKPYPHFVLAAGLDSDQKKRLLSDFPELDLPGSVPVSELNGGESFEQLIAELEGPRFRDIIARKFAVELTGRPVVITARGQMRKKDGRIHTDSKSKLITVLIYLNAEWSEPGGRLRILHGGESLDNYHREIAPLFGTMIGFKVTENCWHGHTAVEGKRLSLQLNYLVSNAAENKHSLLHGLSARVKKALRR